MVRALWTAASGMTAQQTNTDVIANNLANVNTTGYKSESAQFKTLLYQTIQAETTSANGETKPVGAQVGLGSRNSAITSWFEPGALNPTQSNTDFGIEGDGFFIVQNANGELCYTRNGSFNWAINANGGVTLSTSEGYPVMDTTGSPVELEEGLLATEVTVDMEGNICYPDENNNDVPIGIKIGLVQFTNPCGLEHISGSMFKETDASGVPLYEVENDDIDKSTIRQGYLEASNVSVVDQMVNLIVAQRAYEMNSKAIQTADDMMALANQLKQ